MRPLISKAVMRGLLWATAVLSPPLAFKAGMLLATIIDGGMKLNIQ